MPTASAQLLAKLDYSLSAESHSETGRDNKLVSALDLSLNDDLHFSQAQIRYKMQTSAILDHANSRDNLLIAGNLFASRDLYSPSLQWLLDINARQSLNTAGQDVDEFDAQTLTTLSTGPVLRISQGIRGDIEIKAQKKLALYQDSPLDSDSNIVEGSYRYPFSLSQNLVTKVAYETTDYKDDSNKNQDNKITRVSFGLQRQTTALSYLFSAGVDQVESDSTKSETLPSLEATINYKMNSASQITLQYLETAETVTDFNNDAVDDEDTILAAGLIESQKIQASYDYRAALYRFNLLVYRDNIENIVDTVSTAETQTGVNFSYNRKLTHIMDFETSLKIRNNDLKQQETQNLDLTLIYKHSRKLTSQMSARQENDTVNNLQSDDSILLYKLTFNLY